MKYIKRNLFTILLIIGLILLLGYSGVTYLKQEQMITQKKIELEEKIAEHEALLTTLRLLREEVDQLDNVETKESLARQKLNMIMPDEMIYVITFQRQDEEDE